MLVDDIVWSCDIRLARVQAPGTVSKDREADPGNVGFFGNSHSALRKPFESVLRYGVSTFEVSVQIHRVESGRSGLRTFHSWKDFHVTEQGAPASCSPSAPRVSASLIGQAGSRFVSPTFPRP